MQSLVPILEQYGLWIVFANVFIHQVGVPVPAIPIVMVVGALAVDGSISAGAAFAVAIIASILADAVWYAIGRVYGYKVLKTLCKISIEPDSCVRGSETLFERWGAAALVASKFLPGVSLVAPPIAGATKMGFAKFTIASAVGAAVYYGLALGLGLVFHKQIDQVLAAMSAHAATALAVIGGLLVLYVLVKLIQRWAFRRKLRMARISVRELRSLLDAGQTPVILDVRSRAARLAEPGLPGAVGIDANRIDAHVRELAEQIGLATDSDVVLYCACPNEASAVLVAKQLARRGFKRLRPLDGGLDAWLAAG